jgi:hypothetical protein
MKLANVARPYLPQMPIRLAGAGIVTKEGALWQGIRAIASPAVVKGSV